MSIVKIFKYSMNISAISTIIYIVLRYAFIITQNICVYYSVQCKYSNKISVYPINSDMPECRKTSRFTAGGFSRTGYEKMLRAKHHNASK